MIEPGIDTDWYFTDSNNQIAIVASGGGLLPESTSSDKERLTRMIKYFRSLPVSSNDIIIEDQVLQLIDNYNEKQETAYLKDAYFMASRGFYYFDKMILNDYSDFRYYLKAKPTNPLIIDTTINSMKDIIPFPSINKRLETIKHFMVNEIL